ncbi:hypothetical protein EV702DRAFT_733237 [Suillus placidus]|uniref:Uncharacterized protein n=1 Tax=Suillus placidus TaxID=48579 RepID=A0A9P7A249_9AGAM|nr:hypothetical protein EV702DRAFT_733237 [Suillus placidus]
MPVFNSEVAEMASALALQAPGTDAPLCVLEDWGREVVLFLTWLDTEERKALFTLTAVANLQTIFQDQADAHLHQPWLSWARQWLPLTTKASKANLRAFMANSVIENHLASTQQSLLTVATLPEPSNNGKGSGLAAAPAADDLQQDSTDSAVAGARDGKTDKKPPVRRARPSQAKRPREESLQVDARPPNVQTPSSLADRPSNRPRLPTPIKKPAPAPLRMPPPKRSVNELMQENHLRDPCEVSFLSLLNLLHAKLLSAIGGA